MNNSHDTKRNAAKEAKRSNSGYLRSNSHNTPTIHTNEQWQTNTATNAWATGREKIKSIDTSRRRCGRTPPRGRTEQRIHHHTSSAIARKEEMTEQQQGNAVFVRGGEQQNTHRTDSVKRWQPGHRSYGLHMRQPKWSKAAVSNRYRETVPSVKTPHDTVDMRKESSKWITEQTKTVHNAFPCTMPTK